MIQFFLQKKVLVNLITIFIVASGLMLATNINRATYPDVEFDVMVIKTSYPGASAEDVEVNVTKKIEDELRSVSDIDKIRSNSLENLSIIYVWVDQNSPHPDDVKEDIRRAVDRVSDLPREVDDKPQVSELQSSNVAVIEVAVSGQVDESILRKIAKDLEEKINEVKGVSYIERLGYRKREVKILVDKDALQKNYVSLNDVVLAVQNRNIRSSGGTLESYTNEKKIVTFSEFMDPMEVEDVIIRKNFDGKQIKVKEVADVEFTYEDYEVFPRTNKKRSINLLIRSQSGADIIDISEEIQSLVAQVRTHLPQGVGVDVVVDYSRYTESLLGIVQNNALIGFFLVLGVLFIFLNPYTAFWTAAGIPISFLGAILFFPLFGIDINFISLVTLVLVLGMLVDDAIVVAENISRLREKGMAPLEASLKGAQEVMWPVTATIATTIVAFFSLYFMTGVSGKFVRQIPYVVILTLTVSLLECIFILPSHVANSPAGKPKPLLWFEKVKKNYQRIIQSVVRFRVVILGGFFIFMSLAFGLLISGTIKFELFPYTDVDVVYVVAELPDGTSLEQTAKKMEEIESIVDELPASTMVNHTTTIGHHDRDVYGVTAGFRHNWAMMTIFLKPAQERDMTSERVQVILHEKFKNIKGFKKLELDKFNDGPPVGRPITISIVSNDDDIRRTYSKKVFDFLKKQPGVINLDTDDKLAKEELRLQPNYETMAKLGVTAKDVSGTIRAAYSGVVVTSMTRGGEEIDFRVQLKKDQRRNFDVLKDLQVPNQQGRLIHLDHFIEFVPSRGYESIRHYNSRRATTITGDVKSDVITSTEVNGLVVKQFSDEIATVPGLRMVLGGEEQATQESMESFGVALIYCIIAIYFILVILFDSFIQPLIIVAVVPFGLAGVIYTFMAYQMPISFFCIIGTLGLIGVMVNDALVMVSHLNDLRKKHGGLTMDLLVEGCKARLRPVILTTVTTVIGLTPTIYGFGGYEPFIIPLVLSLAGGLLFATPITLLLVPTLYSFGLKKKPVSEGL